jgi:hypothetical protein
MNEPSLRRLLSHLAEDVALVAASPEEQEAWASRNRFPAEEIALQLYDVVPLWCRTLREGGMIDAGDEAALAGMNEYLQQVQGRLFLDGPTVTAAPEWAAVRRLASSALDRLRSRLSEAP